MVPVIIVPQPLPPHLLVVEETAQCWVAEALQDDMLLLYRSPGILAEASQRSTNWAYRGLELMVVLILLTPLDSFLRSLGAHHNMDLLQ